MRFPFPSFRFFLAALWLMISLYTHAQSLDSAAVARQVDSLIKVSRELTGKREFEKALEVNTAAETIALERFGRESAVYGSCCFNHGRIMNSKNDHPESEKWYLEAKAIREKVLGKDHPDYARSLNSLGILYKGMGNYEKAEQLYLEAKAIRERVLGKEHPEYASSLNNLANLYSDMGIYEKAETFYLESKAIKENVFGKEHRDYALSLNNLASLYFEIGNYEKVEPLWVEAKAISERVLGKEHPEYAQRLSNLAVLYEDLANYEKAESLLLEAITIQEKALGKEHLDYARSLNNLAAVYRSMGNSEKAEPLWIEAIAVQEKIQGKENPEYAGLLINLGALYAYMGNHEKAELLYLGSKAIREKVLGKEHPYYAICLDKLAALYHQIGNDEKAETLYLEAKAIQEKVLGKRHSHYAESLRGLANLYETQKYFSKSESLTREAAVLESERLWKSATFLSENELSKYTTKFQKNIADIGAWLIARPSGQRGCLPELTFDNTLFYKGFLLTAANQIKQLALSDSVTIEKFNLLKSYRRRLAAEHAKPIAERKNVAELEKKANDIEKDLVRSVAGYGEAMRQVKWQEVQQALRPGEAAIEFVHYRYYGKNETDSVMYAALVLRPGDEQPLYIPLCEARQLQSHIEAQRLRSINNLYAYFGDSRPSLYQLLWSQLEPLLSGVRTIYYSPSGELHRLNLDAIGEPSGTVLGDRYKLQLLMSTRQLVSPNPQAALTGGSALVFGGIRYDADSTAIGAANTRIGIPAQDTTGAYIRYADRTRGDFMKSWDYLDATGKEAEDIQKILEVAGIRTTLRQGVEATEEVFKQAGSDAPSPVILHLATHGYFFPDPTQQPTKGGIGDEPVFKMSEHPLIRSGLILAGANHAWRTGHPYKGAEDGILTAYEVSQMDLSNTELVVLSACETGLGDIKGNEGVYGLQRAFRIAGVKSILMSLWKVPDEATRQLMTSFYRYWLTDKMSLEDAFRRAQTEMKNKYEDPEMWAGFVLIKG
jgi:CHAT domain-containing protein/Flp pilus assembly protein TadD